MSSPQRQILVGTTDFATSLCLTKIPVYTQPFPSDKCPGCQVNVQYDYSTATNPKNPDQGVLYVVAQRFLAQAVRDKGGKCVTDFAFPVNMGGSETMTISTKVNSSQISSVAKSGISQMLGPNLCVTTPYTTIPQTGINIIPAPSSTPPRNPFITSAPANVSTQSSTQLPSADSQNPSNAASSSSHSTLSSPSVQSSPSPTEETLTVTQPNSSPTEAVPQAALSPDKRRKDNTQRLQIIAGVVTSVLGIAALALALLLWRRYRRHRRGSASSDDTFFQPKPELESPPQVPGSVAKAKVSVSRSTRKDTPAFEMAGETGSMDSNSRWRETYYEERKVIPVPQELKGAEPPRYEMDAERSRNCSISPLTP